MNILFNVCCFILFFCKPEFFLSFLYDIIHNSESKNSEKLLKKFRKVKNLEKLRKEIYLEECSKTIFLKYLRKKFNKKLINF